MAKLDARKLDHGTLEQIRIRGGSASGRRARARRGDLCPRILDAAAFTVGWRCTVAGGWIAQSEADFGASAQLASRDLQWVYRTVMVRTRCRLGSLCVMDAGDDRQIDRQALWRTP